MFHLLVVIALACRVESFCRELSTEEISPGNGEKRCVIKQLNLSLEIGEVEERLHPECEAYKCVSENLVNMCGFGYNDEKQYLLDTSGPNCKDTKNPDCTVTVECIGKPPVIVADKKTSYDIPIVG